MSVLNVVYVGPSLSGRRTSLMHVLKTAGLTVDLETLFTRDKHTFTWQIGELRLLVSAALTELSSRFVYEEVDDPSVVPRGRRELEYIRNADGILFVIDRQQARILHSLDRLERLRLEFSLRGLDLDTRPVVFQVNKSDCRDLCSMEWVRENFQVSRCDYIESVAARGIGAVESLSRLLELILSAPVQ